MTHSARTPHYDTHIESNDFDLEGSEQKFDPLKTGRVLIAEDSSFDFRYLVSCLKATGLISPITWVEDGSELLNFLEGKNNYEDRDLEDVSLIILDLKMPKMDGLSALSAIRTHSHDTIKALPVVVLTTSIFEDDLRQASNLGIVDYIIKPETQKETALMIDDMRAILERL